MKTRRHSLLRRIAPPLLFLLLVVLLWEAAVLWFQTPVYLLPGPLRVAQAAVANFAAIAQSTAITAVAAGCGFVGSVLVGARRGQRLELEQAMELRCPQPVEIGARAWRVRAGLTEKFCRRGEASAIPGLIGCVEFRDTCCGELVRAIIRLRQHRRQQDQKW